LVDLDQGASDANLGDARTPKNLTYKASTRYIANVFVNLRGLAHVSRV
jgi:hypothetical protein